MKRFENTKISYELEEEDGDLHQHTQRKVEQSTYKQIREHRQRDYAKYYLKNYTIDVH